MGCVAHPSAPNERQKDRTLSDTLDAEASGILAWLVRGCLAWQREGLRIPTSVLMARREYREEEDSLGQFLKECCILHTQANVKASRLYERYKAWTAQNTLKAMNGNVFGITITLGVYGHVLPSMQDEAVDTKERLFGKSEDDSEKFGRE